MEIRKNTSGGMLFLKVLKFTAFFDTFFLINCHTKQNEYIAVLNELH